MQKDGTNTKSKAMVRNAHLHARSQIDGGKGYCRIYIFVVMLRTGQDRTPPHPTPPQRAMPWPELENLLVKCPFK